MQRDVLCKQMDRCIVEKTNRWVAGVSSAVHSTFIPVSSTPTYDIVQQVGCSQLQQAVSTEQAGMHLNHSYLMSLSTAAAGAHDHCLAFADACTGRRQADVHDVHVKMKVRPAHSGGRMSAEDVVRSADTVSQFVCLLTGTHG